MRFRYQRYPVRGTGPNYLAVVNRPVVPVRVIGPSGADDVPGLADTGADDTILPDFLIASLGIAIDPSDVGVIEGIEGGTFSVQYASVDLELSDPSGTYRWNARVGLHARHNAVYGQAGFLQYFAALFQGRTREVILIPAGHAPPPAFP